MRRSSGSPPTTRSASVTTRSRAAPSGGAEMLVTGEEPFTLPTPVVSFIVRVSGTAGGDLSGFVHCIQSERKERFKGVDAIGPLIARLLRPSLD